jgi:ribose transport system substrate-binding protein
VMRSGSLARHARARAWLRRGLAACAGLTVVLGVAACGSSSDDSDGGGRASAEDVAITVVNPWKGHPFTVSMECGAQRAADRLGVDVSFMGATEYSVGNVTQVLNAVSAKQPDGVVFMVWDLTAFNGGIASLAGDGARIVAIDGAPSDRSNLLSAITADSEQGGKLAGEAMLERVRPGQKVLVIQESPGNTIQAARGQGFIDAVEAAGVEVLPVQYEGKDVTRTTSILQATLAKHPDLAGIYLTQATGVPPTIRILKGEGKSDQVAIVAYDGDDPKRVESIRNGEVHAAVAQRPDLEAELAVEYLVKSLRGEQVPAEEEIENTLVSTDNIDSPETKRMLEQTAC